MLIRTPCTIIRRSDVGDVDEDNNEIPGETPVETLCNLQQVRRDEPASEGELSVTAWNCYFPAGTELTTADAVEIEGHLYELAGDPWDANQGSAAVNHVEATLVRTGEALVS